MSYTAGETLVAAQVAAVTGFSSSNVARGNWLILNSGVSDHYAILKRGATTFQWEGRSNTRTYHTVIEVWKQLIDDATSYDSLMTHVANIESRLEQYRRLADTTKKLRDANIVSESEVKEQWRNKADGPSWLTIEIVLEWSEQNYVTFAE